jgi:acid phosphatase type 7
VHIVCLDANPYVFPFEPELIRWIETDLRNSKATWKIIAFHHPGFNSSQVHYDAQWMRALSPVFERSGVDLVLNGHVHNYQRTFPLRFAPKTDGKGDVVFGSNGRVDGTFVLDQEFDGKTKTRPNGVLYVVTGAGGAGLYDTAFSNKPERWKHNPPENWVPFTVKLISHTHSLSVLQTEGKRLTLRQIDSKGEELDKFEVTK